MRRRGCRDKVKGIKSKLTESSPPHRKVSVMDRIEGAAEQADLSHGLPATRLCPYLALAIDDKFSGGQFLESHRPVGMELGGADADLGAQAELAAIAETG